MRWSRITYLLLLLGWVVSPRAALGQTACEVQQPASCEPVWEEEETAKRRSYFWGGADYLLWWTRNPYVPVLVTNAEPTDGRPGVLGQGTTTLRYGNENVDFREKHGGRFFVGYTSEGDYPAEVELGYFLLNARTTGFQQSSPGNPVIARPFVNALTNQNDASVVTFPGVLAGGIRVDSDSFFQGGEVNFGTALWQEKDHYVSVLLGVRYLDLSDNLAINETDVLVGPPATTGARITDIFGAQNRYVGGQLGVKAGCRANRWTLDVIGKLGVGGTEQTVRIAGQTVFDNGQVVPAGLLALSSNIGNYRRDVFGIVPEARVNVGFKISDHVTAIVGYSFLYWSRVVRPGDQIDTTLNPNLIPTSSTFGASGGPVRPTATWRETDFWAQGLNLGLQVRY